MRSGTPARQPLPNQIERGRPVRICFLRKRQPPHIAPLSQILERSEAERDRDLNGDTLQRTGWSADGKRSGELNTGSQSINEWQLSLASCVSS
jgi:hypothetical protein